MGAVQDHLIAPGLLSNIGKSADHGSAQVFALFVAGHCDVFDMAHFSTLVHDFSLDEEHSRGHNHALGIGDDVGLVNVGQTQPMAENFVEGFGANLPHSGQHFEGLYVPIGKVGSLDGPEGVSLRNLAEFGGLCHGQLQGGISWYLQGPHVRNVEVRLEAILQ